MGGWAQGRSQPPWDLQSLSLTWVSGPAVKGPFPGTLPSSPYSTAYPRKE